MSSPALAPTAPAEQRFVPLQRDGKLCRRGPTWGELSRQIVVDYEESTKRTQRSTRVSVTQS